ncbi:GAF domain-containing protein [Salinibacterium sp. SWN139]|uniref:sensor histidine kinase n=1 Tax=Salinibacterium sp. SWN139 TaxID=2792055 RepID=UPI0018CD178D|nr:GAF domain-containing protein [Salinibacterium sp. SWN139]MBH0054420.1 GAF domain-containing protein [Salinibacterium sp. SWN139]
MTDNRLQFSNAARLGLENSITEVVENTHQVSTQQGRLRRLRSLLDASRDVLEELDLERVLKRIVEAAVALVDAGYGALGVIHPDGHLERFIHVGMSSDEVHAIGHLPEGHGLLGAVIDSGAPIRLDEIAGDPRSSGFPEHHPPMDSFLAVPVRVHDSVYGNLYLTNRQDGSFTEEDEELISSLAVAAGIAIENARRYQESKRQQRLSDALAEVTSALLSPGTEDVLGVVAEHVMSIVPASLVAILTPSPSQGRGRGRVRVETARGSGAGLLEHAAFSSEESIAARAIAAGTVIVTEEGNDRSLLDGRVQLGPTIAAPLFVSSNPIGALCVVRVPGDPTFTPAEVASVSEFADRAGIAIALAWARRDEQKLRVIEDRSRIARDLHDRVIQRLFATGLGLQALAEEDPLHAVAIDGHTAEIDVAIADIRSAVFTLTTRAASVGPLLRHRLLDVIAELSPLLASSPRMTFSGAIDAVATGTLADDIVAVVTECLANVARHANAKNLEVDITATDTDITVTVEDDGKGIGPTNTRSSGTANLAKRAEMRGGVFTLEPGASHGTRARWCIPLDPGTDQ